MPKAGRNLVINTNIARWSIIIFFTADLPDVMTHSQDFIDHVVGVIFTSGAPDADTNISEASEVG